jgi:hypothetical protein
MFFVPVALSFVLLRLFYPEKNTQAVLWLFFLGRQEKLSRYIAEVRCFSRQSISIVRVPAASEANRGYPLGAKLEAAGHFFYFYSIPNHKISFADYSSTHIAYSSLYTLLLLTLATRSERGTRGGRMRKYYLDRRVRLAVRSERVRGSYSV